VLTHWNHCSAKDGNLFCHAINLKPARHVAWQAKEPETTLNSRWQEARAEFVSVHQDPPLALGSQLARHHLNWHTNLDGLVVNVGELCCNHRPLD
jgi:hypothetical protein